MSLSFSHTHPHTHFCAVRPDASGISCAKAKRLIGWEPKRTWRDYLDDQGKTKVKMPPAVSE
jgi:hypothetical protein